MDNKIIKCVTCGQPIKTTVGGISGNGSHMTCRRCFGESSYAGTSQWTYNPLIGGQGNGN